MKVQIKKKRKRKERKKTQNMRATRSRKRILKGWRGERERDDVGGKESEERREL